ncbi:MAG: helicase HerA domain-containing protein [Beijerinckiaceae bacterium]
MINPQRSVMILGAAFRRRGGFPFGLYERDRLLHTYIIGQTGTGKSTLLGNMIHEDLKAHRGLCLIDPHGDLAEALAPLLGDDDVFWDAADPNSPYGYNPLTRASDAHRPLIASGLIDALKKQWADAWGVRMEHLLRYAILALLEQPSADLTQIVRLYIDRNFRQSIVDRVRDPQVLHFWRVEFPSMNFKTAADGVAPIANKLGALLAHPIVRQALCQPRQPLRFRRLMDQGRKIIVNLAKGRIGSDTADVLGGLVIASLFNAALSRHDAAEQTRRPFFLYVDEFHSFTTLAFAGLLSEVRKYGIGAVLAHQYTAQTEPHIEQAILGNAGSLIAFRTSAADAAIMAKELSQEQPDNLVTLGNFEAICRIMVDGERTRSFTMHTYPSSLPGIPKV